MARDALEVVAKLFVNFLFFFLAEAAELDQELPNILIQARHDNEKDPEDHKDKFWPEGRIPLMPSIDGVSGISHGVHFVTEDLLVAKEPVPEDEHRHG